MRNLAALAAMTAVLAACGGATTDTADTARPKVEVVSEQQKQLRSMDEEGRLIALKRAVFASGARCPRAEAGGFSGRYKNMDQWAVRCSDGREWALFVGADDSVQLRACKDVEKVGLPACRYDGAVPDGTVSDASKAPPDPA